MEKVQQERMSSYFQQQIRQAEKTSQNTMNEIMGMKGKEHDFSYTNKADDFLREQSIEINMKKLYELVSHSYERPKDCVAFLYEIVDHDLMALTKNNYILQVYDNQKTLVCEKLFQKQIQNIAICQSHLVYLETSNHRINILNISDQNESYEIQFKSGVNTQDIKFIRYIPGSLLIYENSNVIRVIKLSTDKLQTFDSYNIFTIDKTPDLNYDQIHIIICDKGYNLEHKGDKSEGRFMFFYEDSDKQYLLQGFQVHIQNGKAYTEKMYKFGNQSQNTNRPYFKFPKHREQQENYQFFQNNAIQKIDYALDNDTNMLIVLRRYDSTMEVINSQLRRSYFKKLNNNTIIDFTIANHGMVFFKDEDNNLYKSSGQYDHEYTNIKSSIKYKFENHYVSLIKDGYYFKNQVFVIHRHLVSVYNQFEHKYTYHLDLKEEILQIFHSKNQLYCLLKNGTFIKFLINFTQLEKSKTKKIDDHVAKGIQKIFANDEILYILDNDGQVFVFDEEHLVKLSLPTYLTSNLNFQPLVGSQNRFILIDEINQTLTAFQFTKTGSVLTQLNIKFSLRNICKAFYYRDNFVLSDERFTYLIQKESGKQFKYDFSVKHQAIVSLDGQMYYAFQNLLECRDLATLTEAKKESIALRTYLTVDFDTKFHYYQAFQRLSLFLSPFLPDDDFKMIVLPNFITNKQNFVTMPHITRILGKSVIRDHTYILTSDRGLLVYKNANGELVKAFGAFQYQRGDMTLTIDSSYLEGYKHCHYPIMGMNDIFPRTQMHLLYSALNFDEIDLYQQYFNTTSDVHNFIVIEIFHEEHEEYPLVKEHLNFKLDGLHSRSQQGETWLFSKDLNLLLRRFPLSEQSRAVFYKLQEKEEVFKWKKMYTIKAKDYSENFDYNYCFSPDLTMYLQQNTFLQMRLIFSEIPLAIPIDTEENLKKPSTNIYKRVRFMNYDNMSNRYAMIWTISEDGVERVFSVEKNNKVRRVYDLATNEQTFNIIPQFKQEKLMYEDNFSYFQPFLIINEQVDSTYCARKSYQFYKALTLGNFQGRKIEHFPYTHLGYEPIQNKFVTVSYYTYENLKLMEAILQGDAPLSYFTDQQLEVFSQTILSNGDSFMTQLAKNGNNSIIEELFARSQKNLRDEKQEFEVAFLQNLDEKSAIHYLIGNSDFRTLNSIMKYLSKYGFDHHSRAIIDTMPSLIRARLPELPAYLESRTFETDSTKRITQGVIKSQSAGISRQSYLYQQEELDDVLELNVGQKKGLRAEIYDIPFLGEFKGQAYHYDFYRALNEENDWYDLLKVRSIQKLIENQFYKIQPQTVVYIFIPFCIYHTIFCMFFNLWYQDHQTERIYMDQDLLIWQIVLTLFSTYFFFNEVYLMSQQGWGYFTVLWNYVNILPSILQFCVFLKDDLKALNGYNWEDTQILLSLCTFFMWCKLLFYLRIFKTTGYLIRMIVSVTYGMRTFLLILLISMAAFADAQLKISYSNDTDAQEFTTSFFNSLYQVYNTILGQYSGAFGSKSANMAEFLFLLDTLFNTIIMLNLLISIISDIYGQNKAVQAIASIVEMNCIVIENKHLRTNEPLKKFHQYLMVFTYLNEEISIEQESQELREIGQMKEQINECRDQLVEMKEGMEKSLNEINEKLNGLIKSDFS